MSFTINMEQIGDIIERVCIDIEDKKIGKGRNFSEAGMAEICDLHARLIANLRLAMSVFLNGDVRERAGAAGGKGALPRPASARTRPATSTRLPDNTTQSIETSVAAPRSDQRSQAHQLAHLLDRLSDPGVGRRTERHAHPAVGAGAAGLGPAEERMSRVEPGLRVESARGMRARRTRPAGGLSRNDPAQRKKSKWP